MDWRAGGHVYHPELQQNLHTFTSHANAMGAICFSRYQNKFQVSEYPRPLEGIVQSNYVVDLRERTCDCGIFQTFKYPCAHIFAACASVHFDAFTLVDPVYRLETVYKVYKNDFPPIGNEEDPNMIDDGPTIQPDPSLRREKHGKPRSTRIYCAEDMIAREPTGQRKHCSICKNPGHTKKTCPQRTGPRIN